MHMFTAKQSTIDKLWKLLVCPSTQEWIRKFIYNTKEYLSVTIKDKSESFLRKRMKFETTIYVK